MEDEPQDQPMADDVDIEEPPVPLSRNEQRVLELHDRIQELRLQVAMIRAQQSVEPDTAAAEDLSPQQVTAAHNELLETRARFLLRNQVVESVLSANPILKAVHNGIEASPVERDLLPYIQERDEKTIAIAKLASSSGDAREQATRAQTDAHMATRKNVELARQVMELVDRLEQKKSGYLGDERSQERVQGLEDELRKSRQRWKMMKGITSGVVAGSGVDWARDHVLRDLVLDPEDDD